MLKLIGNRFNHTACIDFQSKLFPYYDQLRRNIPLTNLQSGVATNISIDYYAYLAHLNIPYGSVAMDVALNRGAFGQFAASYLSDRAHGYDIAKLQTDVRISLAYMDIGSRINYTSLDLPNNKISEYHNIVLAHYRLSPYAWGGVFFENFAGTGSWMNMGGCYQPMDETNGIKSLVQNRISNNIVARMTFCYLLQSIRRHKVEAVRAIEHRYLTPYLVGQHKY